MKIITQGLPFVEFVDFFPPDVLQEIKDEISKKSLLVKNKEDWKDGGKEYSRWHPDSSSLIVKRVYDALYQPKVKEVVSKKADLCWKWFVSMPTSIEVQVTAYNPGDKYDWHQDHIGKEKRMLNYIIYLEEPEGGGELLVSNYTGSDQDKELNPEMDYLIRPTPNTCVIMPSWMLHKVNPVKGGKRLTVNGHVQLDVK
jgi:Rps23 Pro-64 3,4-dihydroxylase Tpa1-like proline 4-hydroxylase